ncbi:MAG: hypothetical protein DRQ56_10410, partial [Gammaproteobacteria bacterium]
MIEADPSQLSLGESLVVGNAEVEEKPAMPVRSHSRKRPHKRKPKEDPGLRFDDTISIETKVESNLEIERLCEDEFEVISEKKTYKLAQRPASYVVLKIIWHVVKRKDTGGISWPPAPPSVLRGRDADVSLLAGMIIDKFRYHLPLYRQHQRIQAAGIPGMFCGTLLTDGYPAYESFTEKRDKVAHALGWTHTPARVRTRG